MKIVGIDPGSSSWDIFVYDSEDPPNYVEGSLVTALVRDNPAYLLDFLAKCQPFDLLVAPSGFGLPFLVGANLSRRHMYELSLQPDENRPLMGLRTILDSLMAQSWKTLWLPGVKHLPTVPKYRKINHLDLGTADKICSVMIGIKTLLEEDRIELDKASFLLIELGSSFSAIIAVEAGQIIDGIGGSNLMGMGAFGAIDGEIAVIAGTITKKAIYSGGLATLLAEGVDPADAYTAFCDRVVKAAYSLLPSFQNSAPINAIFLSGSGAENATIRQILADRLSKVCQLRPLHNFGRITKAAAQGAAFIGEGYLGGLSAPIVEKLELFKASGSILDHIYFEGFHSKMGENAK